MPVPARKLSRSKVRRRRSHDHLDPKNVNTCVKCKAPIMSHHACPACGYYDGRQAVDLSRVTSRILKRKTSTHDHRGHDQQEKHSDA